MSKSSPPVPVAIQAKLSSLRRRHMEITQLIDAVERYLKFLAVEPASMDAAKVRKGPSHRRQAA